jgi:hypothetical protein
VHTCIVCVVLCSAVNVTSVLACILVMLGGPQCWSLMDISNIVVRKQLMNVYLYLAVPPLDARVIASARSGKPV